MAYGNHALEYRKNAVNGASPVQLVIMLYDGALRFMEAGKTAIVEKNLERQNHYLQKSQRIVLELMSSLDMYRGGEISQNLLGLYTYVLEELVSANTLDQTEPIDRAMKTMSELRESWVVIDRKTRTSADADAGVQLAA